MFFQTDKKRQVDEADGRLWADSRGFQYFELSAAQGDGINEMFQVNNTVCWLVCLSFSLSVCLSVFLSVCLSVCLPVCTCQFVGLFLSVYMFVYLSFIPCLPVCVFVCVFVGLSIYLRFYRGSGESQYSDQSARAREYHIIFYMFSST